MHTLRSRDVRRLRRRCPGAGDLAAIRKEAGTFFASLFASIAPIPMRLLGMLPPNGTGALFAIVFVFAFFAATLGLSGFIIVSSMMADVVEDAR